MPDFQPWSELLNQYVDSQGLVNYRAWKTQSTQKLNNWLKELSQTDLEQLQLSDPNQQLALWLNLYNALVIAKVLNNYPIKSILPKFLGIPNWFAFGTFFFRPIYSIDQHRYSLNNIEHDILRRQFSTPCIHFALVCASVGCPLLRNEAYSHDRLETQLDEDAKRFIHNTDKVYYNTEEQTLYCSKIFKWYKQDFLKVSQSIPEYIQTYLSLDIPLTAHTPIKYLDYDWSLNQRISS
jgi:hypothetical protein